MPRKSRWARLPFGVRMTAGTSALLIAIGGGAAGIAALMKDSSRPRIVTAMGEAAQAPARTGSDPDRPAPAVPPTRARMGTDAVMSRTAEEADRTATRAPRRDGDPAAPPATAGAAPAAASVTLPDQPAITTRTDVETRAIPYETQLVRDPSLPRGMRRVQTPGIAGEETLRYLVTLTDGRETDRRLLDTTVTRAPQHEVIAFGGRRGRDRCGETLNFCVPLGRSAMCRQGDDGHVEESATQLGGATIGVLDAELEVPAAGWDC